METYKNKKLVQNLGLKVKEKVSKYDDLVNKTQNIMNNLESNAEELKKINEENTEFNNNELQAIAESKNGLTELVNIIENQQMGEIEEKKENIKNLENQNKEYKEKNINVEYQDERLTTMEASEILSKNNIKKSEQKKYIDSVAAVLILQDYIHK